MVSRVVMFSIERRGISIDQSSSASCLLLGASRAVGRCLHTCSTRTGYQSRLQSFYFHASLSSGLNFGRNCSRCTLMFIQMLPVCQTQLSHAQKWNVNSDKNTLSYDASCLRFMVSSPTLECVHIATCSRELQGLLHRKQLNS